MLAIVFFSTTVVLGAALAGSWVFFSRLSFNAIPQELPELPARTAAAPTPVSPLLLGYKLDLPGRGEIFPALASEAQAKKEYWPLGVLTISNRSDRPVLQSITAQVPGWTEMSEQTVVIGPREVRAVPLSPDLLERAFSNDAVRRATLRVRVANPMGDVTFSQNRPVLLHGSSDLYWGKKFANAQYVARWVTPHEPAVQQLVTEAQKMVPNGRLPGYNARANTSAKTMEVQVQRQVEAVFNALRKSGISYVSSIYTFGDYVGQAQRIRLPAETLKLRSANCVDVSVAFASAMENIGLQPVVVIVPGHAFAGVRLGPQGAKTLYLDLTVLPKGTLRQAIARAEAWRRKSATGETLTVDIAAARALKIYPLPYEGSSEVLAASRSAEEVGAERRK